MSIRAKGFSPSSIVCFWWIKNYFGQLIEFGVHHQRHFIGAVELLLKFRVVNYGDNLRAGFYLIYSTPGGDQFLRRVSCAFFRVNL